MSSKKSHGISKWFGIFLLTALIAVAGGCSDAPPVYEAEIRRTAGGIPHIKAEDFASLGFGTGYAAAEDNLCLLAENFLRYRGQLSRYFGPGEDNENLESDFFYQLMIDRGLAKQEIPQELEALFRGYAAGYNRYLRETGVGNISDPSCQNAEWVGEISSEDIKRINSMLVWLPNFKGLIVAAQPPAIATADATTSPSFADATKAVQELQSQIASLGNPTDKGSNGIALGRDATENGTGMLLANPHLNWEGTWRFYPFHQTIPGVMNMLGATVVERPNVGFGTTEHVAWTNTVSKATRYSFYMLTLAEDSPTTYMFDGEPREMTTEEVTVTVLNPDGSLEERTHTFYSTHFGFLIGRFPWDNTKAFCLRLAHEGDRNSYAAIANYQVKSVRDLKAVADKYQQWISNMIAADSSGEALYADPGALAYLTDEQVTDCSVFYDYALDGSCTECQWIEDPDAAAPGIFPPDMLPFLYRDDYVTNSNDSYWLANPNEPLTGYNKSLGEVETERTLRTRSGLQMVQQRLDGTDGLGGDNKFTLDQLTTIALSNQNYSAQLLRDDLVTLCENNPTVDVDGTPVDISEAGPILEAWDLHADLDSRGAHLFREFMREAHAINGDDAGTATLPAALNLAVPFDPSDPLTTPRGLDTMDNPNALLALATAVQKLRDAGIALDARLGDLQTVTRNGEVIPIHGGPNMEGIFNKVESDPDFEGAGGYPEVTGSSSSWIWATEFTEDGPRFRGILTYSISTNPNSPHFSDQTKMFSQKQWLDIPFYEEDVEAAALQTTVVSEGASDCINDGWKEFTQPEFDSCIECLAYFQMLQFFRVTDFINKLEE